MFDISCDKRYTLTVSDGATTLTHCFYDNLGDSSDRCNFLDEEIPKLIKAITERTDYFITLYRDQDILDRDNSLFYCASGEYIALECKNYSKSTVDCFMRICFDEIEPVGNLNGRERVCNVLSNYFLA